MVFVFGYLWAYCEAILPFLWLEGCAPNNGGKYTLLGSIFFVRVVMTCVMTSLKLVSFWSVENRLFSFSSMLDNDYWATEIIWENFGNGIKVFQSHL